MMKDENYQDEGAYGALRKLAEIRLPSIRVKKGGMTALGQDALIEELYIHQAELEIQNEELRKMQVELARARDRYRDLYDCAPIGYLTLDEGGRILEANQAAAEFVDGSPDTLIGVELSAFVMPQAQDALHLHMQRLRQGVSKSSTELYVEDHMGRQRVVLLETSAEFKRGVRTGRLLSTLSDITERKQAEDALRSSEIMLRTLVDTSFDAILVHDESCILFANAAALKMFGAVSVDDIIGRSIFDMVVPEARPGFRQSLCSVLENQELLQPAEHRLVRIDGSGFVGEVIGVPIEYQSRSAMQLIARDVTARKLAEEKIREAAYFDPLTKLPNRFLGMDRLENLIKDTRRDGLHGGVLFLDLDDFKKINDTLGHEVGDRILMEAATRLLDVIREKDTLARLGGDEFVVLLRDLEKKEDAQVVVDHIIETFRRPFSMDGRELVLTASIGVAICPDDGMVAADLLRNADMAMYRSKEEGRNTYHYFTESMNHAVARRLELEESLHYALAKQELQVHYQPLVDLKSGAVVGAEALLRWQHPVMGDVSPEEFIPVAENTGLIIHIGRYVLEAALREAARWRARTGRQLRVSVNVSPRQFRDSGFQPSIERILQQLSLPGSALELEVTEGVLMNHPAQAARIMNNLSELGVGIAMDDFGTGYSSLNYLREYPFDTMKVDRSFVSDINEDGNDRELVVAALKLAHALDLKVVAEGVENEAQLALLKHYNYDLAQGYYFGAPVAAEQFERLFVDQE